MTVYDEVDKEPQSEDEAILKEVKERYRSWLDTWRPIREERTTDMRYVLGDPWDSKDKAARAADGRPAINHDELGQYIAGAVGNLRAAKRGIQVEPDGNGSSDKSAELRQNLIRSIEYKSQAQGTYMGCYQAMLEGGYAFFRISREYANQDPDGPDDQVICIRNIPNPDSVVYDPDCKKSDWSDPRAVFVLDPLPIEEFKRQYPNAERRDFAEDDRRVARDWIGEKHILVAEYWRVETTTQWNRRHTRKIEKRRVMQYVVNGVEVLERNPQPGDSIPIIAMMGIERWVDEGQGPVRKINSMIRLARDPQMSLAYLCSQQMEEAGLTPKVPYVGYVGQFETDKEAWDTATRKPHAYLQVDPSPESAMGQVLPLPQRVPFTPNIQAYELGKDSCRRAIQAAMGISPLPTAAQRNNEKSGVALERIHQQQAIGTLTFVDKFEAAIAYAGRIINSWIPEVYDTERELGIRMADDKHRVVRINTPQPYFNNERQEEEQFSIGEGDHSVTISAGPSDLSQRQEAEDFLTQLIGNLGALPVSPPQAAKLLSLAIQMKQLGPKGDEMSAIISPDQNQPIPPQAQQAVAGLQQQLQAMHAYAVQQEQQVKQLEMEKQAKIIDNQARMQIERMKIEAQLATAEITTKSQMLSERESLLNDLIRQLQEQQGDRVQQAAQQQHEKQMQAAELIQAAQQQAGDQSHEAGMAAMSQAHDLNLQRQQAAAAQQQQQQQEQQPEA